ncbi:Bcr/CflA family efflux MFS transporter [bacterium]|nr:MAG: Bcr/CflA family efflux MFS transporter [bacterium]
MPVWAFRLPHLMKTSNLTRTESLVSASRGDAIKGLPFLLAALTALTALSIDMSLPAMPRLKEIFGSTEGMIQLTLSLFMLGYSVGQLVCGPLSDRVGRRPVLLGGLAVFALAGFGCAIAPSLPVLIALRLVQGMGASVGAILGRAIVRDKFEGREASGVMSQITQVMILAPLVAPTLGGYLLQAFGWHSIFLFLGIAGLAVASLSFAKLPETIRQRRTESGYVGQVFRGFGQALAHRSTRRHVLTTMFASAGMFSYISGSPFVIIGVFKVPEGQFGMVFSLTAAALMVGATLNRRLLSIWEPTRLLRFGVSIVAAAASLLILCTAFQWGGIYGVMGPMMVYLFGLGMVMPNASAAAMEPHPHMAGLVSSLMGGLQTLAGAVAGFAVGSFFDGTTRSLGFTAGAMGLLALLFLERTSVTAAKEIELGEETVAIE